MILKSFSRFAARFVARIILCGVVAAFAVWSARAQDQDPVLIIDSSVDSSVDSGSEPGDGMTDQSAAEPEAEPPDITEIIRRFAAKEQEFQEARENYTYRQIVKIQELTADGDVGGTFEVQEDILFEADGDRIEKVVYAPLSTLRKISISPEDEKDLRSIQPFVLTTVELPKYDIQYQGRQKVDELDTYVFMVGPKRMERGERYFQGQIWVDQRDLQIVKSYGKAVPDIRKKGQENLFPRFETYREQIDGKYWFPTWTGADDTLHFSSGAQRMRMIVRYEDYKQFRSTIKVTYGDEVPPETPQP